MSRLATCGAAAIYLDRYGVICVDPRHQYATAMKSAINSEPS